MKPFEKHNGNIREDRLGADNFITTDHREEGREKQRETIKQRRFLASRFDNTEIRILPAGNKQTG